MTRSTWMIIGALIAVIAIYAIYDAKNTSRNEAGHDIKQAAQSTGDYIKDTGNEIKRDIQN